MVLHAPKGLRKFPAARFDLPAVRRFEGVNKSVKRTLLFLSLSALICSIVALSPVWPTSIAQQTVTDEVTIRLLPIATNVIGTFVRSVSHDGKRIAFDSINDYNGRNLDSNTEIWVYDVDSRTPIMITDTKNLTDPADSTKVTRTINNVTPVISGDGTKIVFVSNADLAGTNADGNFEIYLADLPRGATTATITRLTDTGADFTGETVKEIFSNFSPAINDDGSTVAFLSTRRTLNAVANGPAQFTALKEGPNNADPDGNAELFLLDIPGRRYSQATATRDVDATVNFTVRGFNGPPHLSGDGRTLAFISGFNFAGANANKNTDFNGEIYLYKVGDSANTVTQVTDTTVADSTDGPVVPQLTQSGFYIKNSAAPMNLLPADTRPLNRDGSLITFESAGNFDSGNADKTREVWLYNTGTKAFRRITTNTAVANFKTPTQDELAKVDYNMRPSINSTGTFITFASVLNFTPATTSSVKTDNADASREVFRFDIAGSKTRQISFGSQSGQVFDQRDVGLSPQIDTTGAIITFSQEANLLAPRAAAIVEQFQALVRTVTSTNATEVKMTNAASFDATQVARGSIVAAFGTQLANGTASTPSAALPTVLGGVSVSVDNIAAGLIFVSAGQVNFVMPNGVATGDAVTVNINNNGVLSTGKVKIVDGAPGVFSANGTGKGVSTALCGRVSPDGLSFNQTLPPCSVGNESQADLLIIYGTGWRNVTGLQVKIGDVTLTPSGSGAQPDFDGLDQINVNLTKDLADKKDLEITVTIPGTTPIDSNKTTTSFRPIEAALTVANAASFDAGFVGRDSLAIAQGTDLAGTTAASPNPVLSLGGVSVTVAGRPALLNYVSPAQINFNVPEATLPAELVEVVVNNNGANIRGRVRVLEASPGIYTTTDNGAGVARVQCGRRVNGQLVFSAPPCAVGTEAEPNIIRVFGTGWRRANVVTLNINGTDLESTYFGGFDGFGIDAVEAKLIPALAGKADVDVIVKTLVGTTARDSKTGVKTTFQ
jgi:uncharacterized protein (TIGR03437 family)